MGRKSLTTEEFIDKAKDIHKDTYGYSKVIYKGSKIKVIITCKKHGDFLQTPGSHLAGRQCSVCSGNHKHTFETLSEAINEKHNSTITLIHGQVIKGVDYKYKFRHICGYEWVSIARNIMKGNSCPRCSKRVEYTFETLSEAISNKHNNSITLVDGQVISGIMKKYNFRHICGHEWVARANNILHGKGCPVCASSGFNPDKPGVFYILEINGHSKFTGFGISNSYKSRKSRHRRNLKNNNCSIMNELLISSNGSVIQELEQYVKQTLQCNNSDIEGFKTESVLMTPKALLDFCEEWLIASRKEYSTVLK